MKKAATWKKRTITTLNEGSPKADGGLAEEEEGYRYHSDWKRS